MTTCDIAVQSFDRFMDRLKREKDFRIETTISSELSDMAYWNTASTITQTVNRIVYSNTIRYWIDLEPAMKPAKAIAKHVKQEFDIKLDNATKEKIGQYLKPPDPRKIAVRFSLGCAGESYEYYHEDSCYWGCYAKSRDIIEASQGGAVRMYSINEFDDEQIIARSWFVPYTGEGMNGIVIFNAYGDGELQKIDRQGDIIARVLDTQSQLTSMHVNTDDIFINTCRTMLLGSVQDPNVESVRIYVQLEEPYDLEYAEDMYRCDDCGEYCHEDYLHGVCGGDRTVCDDCLQGYYYVENGQHRYRYEYWPEDDVIYVQGECYHMDDESIVCDVHGDYHLCDDCGDTWEECSISGEIYPIDEMCLINYEWVHSDYVITDAHGDQHVEGSGTYHECDYDGEYYPDNEMIPVANGVYVLEDNLDNWMNDHKQETFAPDKVFDAVQ